MYEVLTAAGFHFSSTTMVVFPSVAKYGAQKAAGKYSLFAAIYTVPISWSSATTTIST